MKGFCRCVFGRGAGKRLLGILLAAVLFSSMAVSASAGGIANVIPKTSTSRAIAIVFDNSGSMYSDLPKAWCQATYAIEIFASMMNGGDVLQVYPMNPIEIDGISYTSDNPFVVSNVQDASQIRNIYTPKPSITPVETISAAYSGLTQTQADERWLIVLTDGNTFYENSKELSQAKTQERLTEILTECNQGVNVLYLGIDTTSVPGIEGPYTHSGTSVPSAEVPAVLSRMCNLIFGRDELPEANKRNNVLDIDIPLGKLIVFVQGENVQDITVQNSAGTRLTEVSSYSAKYSTLGGGAKYADMFEIDNTLQGMIVTYGNCPADQYQLSYSGTASSVTAYYEPDVDLAVFLLDENGERVDFTKESYAGTYYLEYGLVDSQGNAVSSSLLGTTDYTVTYTLNGEPHVIQQQGSGRETIELKEEDSLNVDAFVTFLGGYRINKTGSQLGWPEGNLVIKPRPVGVLSLSINGGQDTYALSEFEGKAVYQIQAVYDGNTLTGEALSSVTPSVSIDGGNIAYDLVQTENGYELTLGHAGDAKDTVPGEYTLRVSAAYIDEFLSEARSEEASKAFVIEDETSALSLKVDRPQGYYVISKVGDGKPIVVNLTLDGEPLTEEQMAQTVLNAESEGLTLLTAPVDGESAYTVVIDPGGKLSSGIHDIVITASSLDKVGRTITAEAETDVELQSYPLWMRILFILACILIPLLLIWLFMNKKVLPKDIRVSDTDFSIRGRHIGGTASCNYSGKGKSSGNIIINSPKAPEFPALKLNIELHLEAVSPRYTKSSQRKSQVKSLTGSSIIESIKFGGTTFVKDPAGRGFVKAGGRNNAFVPFEIGNNTKCTVVASTRDPNTGRNLSASMTFKFRNF